MKQHEMADDARCEVLRIGNAIADMEENPPQWFPRFRLWLLRAELFFAKGCEQQVQNLNRYEKK